MRWLGFMRYTTRDATPFRNAGPLVPYLIYINTTVQFVTESGKKW